MVATRFRWTKSCGRPAPGTLRTLAKMAVLAPVIATGVVFAPSFASAARELSTPYHFAGEDPKIDARYDAYVPVMRQTEAAISGEGTVKAQDARRVATLWWSGFREGRLLPLAQVRYDESVFDGATGQVLRANSLIEQTLRVAAMNEAWQGNADAAVADALASMKVTEPLKYTDSVACGLIDASVRRDLMTIGSVAGQLTPAARQAAIHDLEPLRPNGRALGTMLSRIYNLYLQDFASRRTVVPELPSLVPLSRAENAAATADALRGILAQIDRDRVKYAGDPFLAVVRRSASNELNTDLAWMNAVKRLG